MKLTFYVGLLLALSIIAITLIVALGREVPNEFTMLFSALASFFLGVITQPPKNGVQKL